MPNFARIIIATCRLHGLILLVLLLIPPFCADGSQQTQQFINNGGYIVHDASRELNFRAQDPFIPASTLKILTCLAAFEKLGKGYQFETHFFLDRQNNLYVKGYGDPFLTSEVVLEIGRTLAGMGVRQVRAVFLDDNSFSLNGETAGEERSANPYDAPNGALVVNFNALPVQVAGDNTISSGEAQTPLIPLMTEAGHRLTPGRHHINIDTVPHSGRLSPALRYAGELLVAQFRLAGISVAEGYGQRAVPPGMQPIFVHYCIYSLEELVRTCLKFSNNFIANQLFLACGIKDYGLPATWDKSRQALTIYAEKSLHLGPDQIIIREGSGLSRQNRASPAALLAVLELFKPYSSLLNRKNNVLLKSGTMRDVYCYAGYFSPQDTLIPFVILLNQPDNNRDRVLQVLARQLGLREKDNTHTN